MCYSFSHSSFVLEEDGMTKITFAKPIIKWAGGKTQLLSELLPFIPANYSSYIEPFVGGGAVFFHLAPARAVIADTNPELITMYEVVKKDVASLIKLLISYPYSKDFFYSLRSQNPNTLDEVERAARFIYLNKTGYNGLYRVNKQGEFNVPFGSQKSPKICDEPKLKEASEALKGTKIVLGDYRNVLLEFASPGDFVFLDPPYHPTARFSDFTRYTKEFFYAEDQIKLATLFKELSQRGIDCLLTNSNTEFIKQLYQGFSLKVVSSKRNINSNGAKRTGEDLIISSKTSKVTRRGINSKKTTHSENRFPGTRFMGSKFSMLDTIWETVQDKKFSSVLDAFAGSGCVSYLFKTKGKKVFSNDLLNFSYHTTSALIENNNSRLGTDDIYFLLSKQQNHPTFIQDNFSGLYFTDEENEFLDMVRFNINYLDNKYKQSIAISALTRACLKKRPRGVFTYVGNRYNDNRRDIQISLREHFLIALNEFNCAVFDNQSKNKAFNNNIFDIDLSPDLVYIDPPYYSPKSDSDYVRRYHFVEGLAKYWEGISLQEETKTKKFKKYDTPFHGKESTHTGLSNLFEKFKKSILLVSYSSNSLPTKSDIENMLLQYKRTVTTFEIDHVYSFGNQKNVAGNPSNKVKEYLFLGY